MVEYGPEPPWTGRSRYGYWERGRQLWDGSECWVWVPPLPMIALLDPEGSEFYRMFARMWAAQKARNEEVYATKVAWLEDFPPRRSPIRLSWWKRWLWRAE